MWASHPWGQGLGRMTMVRLCLATAIVSLAGCKADVAGSAVGNWTGNSKAVIGGSFGFSAVLRADKTFSVEPSKLSLHSSGTGAGTGTWSVVGRKLQLRLLTLNKMSLEDFKEQRREFAGAFRNLLEHHTTIPYGDVPGLRYVDPRTELMLASLDKPIILNLSDDLQIATLDTTAGMYAGNRQAQFDMHKQ